MAIRILSIAGVVTLIGIIWLLAIAGLHPRQLLLWLSTMDPVFQLCCVLSIGSAAFSVVSLRGGSRRHAWIGVASAFGWSIVGAALSAATARTGLIAINPRSPSRSTPPTTPRPLLFCWSASPARFWASSC